MFQDRIVINFVQVPSWINHLITFYRHNIQQFEIFVLQNVLSWYQKSFNGSSVAVSQPDFINDLGWFPRSKVILGCPPNLQKYLLLAALGFLLKTKGLGENRN